MKKRVPQNWKEIMTAIIIGACISFLTALFDGLAAALRDHSQSILAGGSSAAYYLAVKYRV